MDAIRCLQTAWTYSGLLRHDDGVSTLTFKLKHIRKVIHYLKTGIPLSMVSMAFRVLYKEWCLNAERLRKIPEVNYKKKKTLGVNIFKYFQNIVCN